MNRPGPDSPSRAPDGSPDLLGPVVPVRHPREAGAQAIGGPLPPFVTRRAVARPENAEPSAPPADGTPRDEAEAPPTPESLEPPRVHAAEPPPASEREPDHHEPFDDEPWSAPWEDAADLEPIAGFPAEPPAAGAGPMFDLSTLEAERSDLQGATGSESDEELDDNPPILDIEALEEHPVLLAGEDADEAGAWWMDEWRADAEQAEELPAPPLAPSQSPTFGEEEDAGYAGWAEFELDSASREEAAAPHAEASPAPVEARAGEEEDFAASVLAAHPTEPVEGEPDTLAGAGETAGAAGPSGAGQDPSADDAPLREVADRLERMAQALRGRSPAEVLAATRDADPLAMLIAGYTLGYAEAAKRSRGTGEG